MAEAAAAYFAEALWAANFVEAAVVVLNYGAAAIQAAAFVASVYASRQAQKRAENRARNAFNDSLRDRYLMFRATTEPRRIVLGDQRTSGPLAYIGSYGANKENLVYAAIMAAEEIDSYVEYYFDDELLLLDGAGFVIGQHSREQFSISAATASFTLAVEPKSGTVSASADYGSGSLVPLTIVSVVGNVVSVSGATPSLLAAVTVRFIPNNTAWTSVTSVPVTLTMNFVANVATAVVPYDRIADLDTGKLQTIATPPTPPDYDNNAAVEVATATRTFNTTTRTLTIELLPGSEPTVGGGPYTGPLNFNFTGETDDPICQIISYTGAPGQTANAEMIAAAPGLWTTAHVMTNLAYIVVKAKYKQEAFPGGLMSISARVKGSKIYDARTGVTAYSDNPALQTRHIAYHPLFGNQPSGVVNDALCNAASNACDESVTYNINGLPVVRKKYTSGIVAKNGTAPKDIMDDLVAAMAGRWVYSEGEIFMRAGVAIGVTQTLDESWLSDSQPIEVRTGNGRADMVNIITGSFADSTRAFVEMPFTDVSSSAYIAEDGEELGQDIRFNAIIHNAQCQQVAASMLRDTRQDLGLTLPCNMRAFRTQVLDVINVTLPRFGFSNLRVEVLDRAFTLDGGIMLTLKKQDANAWNMGLSFTEPVPNNTTFRNPSHLQLVQNLQLFSGPSENIRQIDGITILRLRATWNQSTDGLVLFGGGVELRYGPSTLPFERWTSMLVSDGASTVYLTGLQEGAFIGVQARFYTQASRGGWGVCKWIKLLGGLSSRIDATGVTTTPLATDTFGPHSAPFANLTPDNLCTTTLLNNSARPWQVEVSFTGLRRLSLSGPATGVGGGTSAAVFLQIDSLANGSVGPTDYGLLQPGQMFIPNGQSFVDYYETSIFHYQLAPGDSITASACSRVQHFNTGLTAELLTRDALLRLTAIKM